jgi:hypothetical protein
MAASTTWTGTGDWFANAGNWNNGVPNPGDDAVVASGSVALTNDSTMLGSFTMTNGTLTFSNLAAVVQATNVWITGGTVRHVVNSDTSSAGGWAIIGRVYFACTNFYLGTNATINVNVCGWGAPTGSSAGYGEGAGGARAGAGYGGFGGNYAKLGGPPYGVAETPDKPGSGGGGFTSVAGGFGGGLVRIESPGGTVTVHGVISANGGAGGGNAAGGSGGGIYISCRTLAGSGGTITANGGDRNGTSGAGGGGRIAVAYDPQAQSNAPACSVTFSARMGAYAAYPGDLGTLWFPDNTLLGETVKHTGQWMAPANVWEPATLTVTNGLIRFPAAGMHLTVAGDAKVTGAGAGLELGGNASMGNTMYRGGIYQNYMLFSAMASPPEMRVGGNLTLTNGGLLRLYSAPTNGSPHGALLAVTGNLVVASASALYPVSDPTNGGSLRIVANNVSVLSSGSINADTAGFGPGRTTVSGEGGFGQGGGGSRAGGGYGGFGGNYANLGGLPYGDFQAPRQPGSGGGNTTGASAGPGGGLIWIEAAGWIRVDGTLTANGGTSANGSNSGGGSGGGIHLTCQSFASAGGTISANGATPTDNNTGSGGGGRISIEYDPVAQAAADPVNVTLLASAGSALYLGDLGTVYLPDSQLLRENMNVEGQIMGFPSWNPNELQVNNRRTRFVEDGFALAVSNNLTIDGASALLELGGGYIFPRGSYWDKVNGETPGDYHLVGLIKYSATTSSLTCGGSLVLTNGGDMGIYSGPTNTSGGCGALVDIEGDMTIGANSWIFPMSNPTNGGSALFRMKNLTIPSGNAGFNAYQGGFAGGGGSRATGYGPGGATAANQGGGYGGVGGTTSGSVIPGATYGSSNAPIDPGSGGGRSATTTTYLNSGGAGGGLIRLEIVETLLLEGQLRANGRYGSETRYSGGGSGGGIYVRCKTISGGGSLTANGGSGYDGPSDGASGGGGRIAVSSVYSNGWTGSATVNPGTANVTMLGATGTVVWVQAVIAKGTIINIR